MKRSAFIGAIVSMASVVWWGLLFLYVIYRMVQSPDTFPFHDTLAFWPLALLFTSGVSFGSWLLFLSFVRPIRVYDVEAVVFSDVQPDFLLSRVRTIRDDLSSNGTKNAHAEIPPKDY